VIDDKPESQRIMRKRIREVNYRNMTKSGAHSARRKQDRRISRFTLRKYHQYSTPAASFRRAVDADGITGAKRKA
jgi:hypothetical protein